MKTITYVCDRCGHIQDRDRRFLDTDRWMRTVTIVMEDGHHDVSFSTRLDCREAIKSVLWCEACCDTVGLVRRRQPAKADDPAPPTLEDMLREIIREEIGNNQ